jgi:hypothetical protein
MGILRSTEAESQEVTTLGFTGLAGALKNRSLGRYGEDGQVSKGMFQDFLLCMALTACQRASLGGAHWLGAMAVQRMEPQPSGVIGRRIFGLYVGMRVVLELKDTFFAVLGILSLVIDFPGTFACACRNERHLDIFSGIYGQFSAL